MSPVRRHNGKLVVRTGCNRESPFLRSVLPILTGMAFTQSKRVFPYKPAALDLGCGSGRNGKFLEEAGFEVLSFDRCPPDRGHALDLEMASDLPVFTGSVDVVLFQFVAMFLSDGALNMINHEITRVASPHCLAVVEVAAVKSCLTPTVAEAKALCMRLTCGLMSWGWSINNQGLGMHFLASRRPLPDRFLPARLRSKPTYDWTSA